MSKLDLYNYFISKQTKQTKSFLRSKIQPVHRPGNNAGKTVLYVTYITPNNIILYTFSVKSFKFKHI